MKKGTNVDSTIIENSTSKRNAAKSCDPDSSWTKKAGKRLINSTSGFLCRIFVVLKDRSGEGCLGDIIPSFDKAEEITVLVINGIKYIVASHFKVDGKDAVESVYRLMERESAPA